MKAGQISGDLVFPIPYCPELHFSEFASAVADMKNSVADRSNAQSSCAGLFIASHLGFDYSGVWIHVDMATPVHAVSTHLNFVIKCFLLLSLLFRLGRKSHRIWRCFVNNPVWNVLQATTVKLYRTGSGC